MKRTEGDKAQAGKSTVPIPGHLFRNDRRPRKRFNKFPKSGMLSVGGKVVDVSQSSARTWAVALASAALALPVGGALGEEAPDAVIQVLPQEDEPADRPIAGTGGRVFLAAAVGEARVAGAADIVGRKVYADRKQVAGSAAVVSFSSTAPRPGVANSANGQLGAPLARAVVSGRFGALRAQGGGGTRVHAGVDLAAPQGTQVSSTLDGRVSVAGWSGSYGLLVVVEHPGGMQTRYAHLSSVSVSPGQTVRRGELLGRVGSTGRSTGPHLHYELRQNGRPVDPLSGSR